MPIYERRTDPLLARAAFLRRVLLHGVVAFGMLVVALSMGVIGYRLTEGMPWIDALLNASMILGGMGPVNQLNTHAGKLFASFYALFAGVVFIGIAAIVVAPVAHRILHSLHLEPAEPEQDADQP